MKRWYFSFCFLFIDALIFIFTLFISVQSRKFLGYFLEAFSHPLILIFSLFKNFLVSPFVFLIFAYEGLYFQNFHPQEETKRILKGVNYQKIG